MRLLRNGLRGALFALFLVANPAYLVACSNDGFTFDEPELLEVAEGVNDVTWAMDDEYEMELSLEQSSGRQASLPRGLSKRSLITSAHACGSRSFVKSAAACGSETRMPLNGTMRIYRLHEDAIRELIAELSADGEIWVGGNNLTHAQISLTGHTEEAQVANVLLGWTEERGSFQLLHLTADGLGSESLDLRYAGHTDEVD